jgi:hypothetical protein
MRGLRRWVRMERELRELTKLREMRRRRELFRFLQYRVQLSKKVKLM